MTRPNQTPRAFSADQLHTALADVGGPARPDYLTDIVAQAGRVRQRPGWTFPGRWIPTDVAGRHQGGQRAAVLSATLVLLALLAALACTSPHDRPRPWTSGSSSPSPAGSSTEARSASTGSRMASGRSPASSDPSTTIRLVQAGHGSSDGTRLLIQKGNENLFVLHADGSETLVTEQWGLNGRRHDLARRIARRLRWPDPAGRRICEDGGLFAVDADGGPAELLWEWPEPQESHREVSDLQPRRDADRVRPRQHRFGPQRVGDQRRRYRRAPDPHE